VFSLSPSPPHYDEVIYYTFDNYLKLMGKYELNKNALAIFELIESLPS
jgi:hypothetical protein